MAQTTQQLLDAAETRLRHGGFHRVSFRDLAADLGIKSASVHYHFPRKEDLGAALVERYSDRFFEVLQRRVEAGEPRLPAYIASYRESLMSTDRICLGVILAAESAGLPAPVRAQVVKFLERNVSWLEKMFSDGEVERPRAQALHTLAALQGAMLLAVNLGGLQAFDAVASDVVLATRVRMRREPSLTA